MKPELYSSYIVPAALTLLPLAMDTSPARAMMIAIGLQESRLENRRQIGGPARSYSQFEVGGLRGVLTHPASRIWIRQALTALDYDAVDVVSCYQAVEHNDVLCAVFTRLLLYTLPDMLPGKDNAAAGWDQYVKAWRPGKPIRSTWDAYFNQAWSITK